MQVGILITTMGRRQGVAMQQRQSYLHLLLRRKMAKLCRLSSQATKTTSMAKMATAKLHLLQWVLIARTLMDLSSTLRQRAYHQRKDRQTSLILIDLDKAQTKRWFLRVRRNRPQEPPVGPIFTSPQQLSSIKVTNSQHQGPKLPLTSVARVRDTYTRHRQSRPEALGKS